MTILTTAEGKVVAAQVARHIHYVLNQLPATRDVTHFVAMVDQIDEVMDATTNQMQGAYPATKVEAVFLQHIRTALPNATVLEAGLALAFWAMKRAGV